MRMRAVRNLTLLLFTCAVLLLGAGSLLAQTFQGGLRGAVRDAQGVIPGATVTLTNEATNTSRDTTTNAQGEFSFPALDPGTYTVKATVQGYKTYERHGVRVATQQFITLDVLLEVGQVQETITVTGQAPLVDTSNASTGDVIDQAAIKALPTIGRNVFLLATTVPTVVSSGDTHWNRMQDQTGSSLLSLGGGGVRANNYLLDGFPTTDMENRSASVVSMEAAEEVKVQVHTYDTEMGRTGGGVFNVTAKSGTNDYHGSGFFQWRPLALSANQYFLNLANEPKVDSYWHDFAGSFGGPIVKNKTFFWWSAEAYRDGLPQNGNMTMPTSAELAGNFSGLTDRNGNPITIYDPLSTDPVTGARQAFPGNIIPANRINPAALKLLSYLPTGSVDNGSANYFASDVIADEAQQSTIKVNHNFSDSISLSGFYLWQLTHEPYNNFFPNARFAATDYQLNRKINNLVLNNTYVLNNSTVLTLRYGWNRFDDNDALKYPFDIAQVPFSSTFINQVPISKYPELDVNGYGDANGFTGFAGVANNRWHTWGVNGSVTKLAGSHSVKMGADYRLLGDQAYSPGQSAGIFSFNGQFTASNGLTPGKNTGNAIADLLLGYPYDGNMPLATPIDGFIKYYGGYAQDDWRVNDKLTLNYGLRLEHETGLEEANNGISVGWGFTTPNPLNSSVTLPPDPFTGQSRQVLGGLIFAGQNGANVYQGDPPGVKLSPRVGLVYSLDKNSVIRGGYGVFWAPWNFPSPGTSSWGQYGYSSTTSIQQNTLVPITSLDNPFPNGLIQPSKNTLGALTNAGSSIAFVDPSKKAPRVQQYSVDYERELPGDSSVTVGYVGAKGTDLGWGGTVNSGININQLPVQYASLGSQLTKLVPNPFYGVAGAGGLATQKNIQYGQLLRPYPEFLNVLEYQTTAARSIYNAATIEFRKRTTGWWGGSFSYTYSNLKDDQFGQSNYYSSNSGTGQVLNNYNPASEYSTSLLDQPHKLVIAPIFHIATHKTGAAGYVINDWQIAFIGQMQSGFPVAVSQNVNNSGLFGSGQRPNVVPGVNPILNSDIISTLNSSNGTNDQYLNPAAWSNAPAFTFGNAPRTNPSIRTPWRNSLDLAVSKDFPTGGSTRAQVRIEVINLTNTPWFVGFNTKYGSSSFGQVTTQGNYSRITQITFRFLF